MKKSIFVALSTFANEGPEPLLLLEKSGLPFSINKTGKRLTAQKVVEMAQNFDGVVAGLEPYDVNVLNQLPRLKCISRCGVGVDNVDLVRAQARGILVCNTPQAVILPVAELTLAMILDLLRQVTAHTVLMRQRKWAKITSSQLAGKTIGIIGLGRIGKKVAELLGRLDCHIVGYDLQPDESWAKSHQVLLRPLEELLSMSDVVTLHLTALGNHPFILGEAYFQKMKPGAFLVNTSRGALIDEDALAKALKSGYLSGAGLDVYNQEPYTGPLCDLSNVILTPHVATLTKESRLMMEIEAVENVLAGLDNQTKRGL